MRDFKPGDWVRVRYTPASATISGVVTRAIELRGVPFFLVQIKHVMVDGEPQQTKGFSFIAAAKDLEHIEPEDNGEVPIPRIQG